MSSTTNNASNTAKEQDVCVMCLNSFDIQLSRTAWKCINKKCGQLFCIECFELIQICNGDNKRFRCMYCLQEYEKNQLPEKNQVLMDQLRSEAVIQYGIKYTRQLLLNTCTLPDLICDIDCRLRQLKNLISTCECYASGKWTQEVLNNAKNVVKDLTNVREHIEMIANGDLTICKNAYRKAISIPDDNDNIGSLFIRVCEDLQLEISKAECASIFPKTYAKMASWKHEQGSGEDFQPKVPELIRVVEQDLIDQWSNSCSMPRIKIGFIGYTSSGKSTVVNRLLGVKSSRDEEAAPISATKSTYFPLRYDRKQSLVDPAEPGKRTWITVLDMQGLDNNTTTDNTEVRCGNYLDEIRKSDCDIYAFVYDKELSNEQEKWIVCIEEKLKRKCILVRSKIDIDYLEKFKRYTGVFYSRANSKTRSTQHPDIIRQLELDNSHASKTVYLVACGYFPTSADAEILMEEHKFDFPKLLNELGRLAFDTCRDRIQALAYRTIARAINTIFRRGYVLNVMKYKVAAGFASIIPFGDQLPRYLSRDDIRDAFGIDDALRQYLTNLDLVIYNYKLQTSVFKDCVKIKESQINSNLDVKWIGAATGTALLVGGGGFTDDLLNIALPAATVLSGAAHIAFTVATVGVGIAISAGISAWSAVESGKHIFSYINRICDDIIMLTGSQTLSIIDRERQKFLNNECTVALTTCNIQNER